MPTFDAIGMDAVGASSASAPTTASADLGGSYSVLGAVYSALQGAYLARATVASDLAGSYTIIGLTTSPVSTDLAGSYGIRRAVFASLSGAYQIMSSTTFSRAPVGSGYCGYEPVAPDTLRRVGNATLAVSLDAARTAARTDGTELDADIADAAMAYTEEAEHITQRAFGQQAWRATFRSFPGAMRLPMPPLINVVSVKYYDATGVQSTLDPQDYVVDSDSEPAFIVPAAGRAWPATVMRVNAVEVEYVCGFGPSDADVPAAIRQYVLAKVQQKFAPVGLAKPPDFEGLLDRWRVYA